MKALDKFREPVNVFPTNLTAAEQDIFALTLCEISKVVGYNKKAEKSNNELKLIPSVFEFSEDELMRLFNCSKSNLIKTLKPAALSLKNQEVGYSDNDGFDYFSPLARVSYRKGQPFRVEMLPSVAELIADNVQAGFSEMDFRLFVSLSGRYERRILKLLSQWKTSPNKKIKLTIAEYREIVGVPDGKYKAFDNFRRKCVESTFADIIEKSGGIWTATDKDGKGFELIKKGRSYTHIEFKVKYNAQALESNENVNDEVKEAASAMREAADLIHGAIKGDQDCFNNPEFTLGLVGDVLSKATTANSGDEFLIKVFDAAVLNTNEVITICGQAMMMLMGMPSPDSFHTEKGGS